MAQLSPSHLVGETRTRWERSRREFYRGLLRDPGVSDKARALARKKIEDLAAGQFVAYPEVEVVEPKNGVS